MEAPWAAQVPCGRLCAGQRQWGEQGQACARLRHTCVCVVPGGVRGQLRAHHGNRQRLKWACMRVLGAQRAMQGPRPMGATVRAKDTGARARTLSPHRRWSATIFTTHTVPLATAAPQEYCNQAAEDGRKHIARLAWHAAISVTKAHSGDWSTAGDSACPRCSKLSPFGPNCLFLGAGKCVVACLVCVQAL